MKISFLSPAPNMSGGCRVIAIYADKLHQMGHDVTVIAAGPRPYSWKHIVKDIAGFRWPQRPATGSHFDTMQAPLRVLPHDGPATDEDMPDADVVIATFWATAFTVSHLAASKGRKFYFVQHHEVHLPDWRHISAGTYFLPLRKIAVASWISDVMRDRYHDESVQIVPNSVDPARFFAPARNRNATPTVGFMFSEKAFKGVDVTLEAIRLARLRRPDLQVVAFGEDRPKSKSQLPQNLRFFTSPSQSDLRAIYSLCDVFVAGSRSEGFGLPILEAMACRCPVVATRTGCAPDVIDDGINGHVVDIDDTSAFGDRIADILDLPPERWRAMSDAALATTEAYTWDDAAQLFERALKQP